MDHGNPTIEGAQGLVLLRRARDVRAGGDGRCAASDVGDHVKVLPAHVDPTMALHERMHIVNGDDVIDTWAVDLRGW